MSFIEGCDSHFWDVPWIYFAGETGLVQHESIWPAAARGQSSRRQHSAAFASANARLTQSPVLTRRTANPKIMPTGLNDFIAYKVDRERLQCQVSSMPQLCHSIRRALLISGEQKSGR